MNPLRRSRAAQRVADHPAHGITCSNRPGADQCFALLQGDVGHLPGFGVDLEQCTFAIGIALDGIVESCIVRFDPGSLVRRSHMALRIRGGVRGRGAARGSGGGLPRGGGGICKGLSKQGCIGEVEGGDRPQCGLGLRRRRRCCRRSGKEQNAGCEQRRTGELK